MITSYEINRQNTSLHTFKNYSGTIPIYIQQIDNVNMKRIQLFEFEDLSWLPNIIRTGATNLLNVFHQWLGTSEVLAKLLTNSQQKAPFSQIVDLGAGSGGPMMKAVEKINKKHPQGKDISLLLTDKYPDAATVQQINNLNKPHIKYASYSVDAAELENTPVGLKTMVASFHHMPPAAAQRILASAEKNNESILIYEILENNIPVIIWALLLPISLSILVVMAMFLTPFVRPLNFSQLFFTYIIPLIPIVYAWDGQASIMRTYTFQDITGLMGQSSNKHYKWEIAPAQKSNGKKAGYYIFGYSIGKSGA